MIAPLLTRRAFGVVLLAAATALPLGAFAQQAKPAVFIERLGDVPLMPGLSVVERSGVDFDAPGGRIVEVAAAGPVTRAAVLEFYRRSLPPLGWTGRNGVFVREGEKLRLELAGAGGRTEVRFFLSPAQ